MLCLSKTQRLSAALLAVGLWAGTGYADTLVVSPPVGAVHFGTDIKVLANGNIVVVDPDYDTGSGPVGAAFLYTRDGQLISSLMGNASGDQVGSGGIVSLANGNYLIVSPFWANGAATHAGAVTWGSAASGVSGVVSSSNSIVGSTAGDLIGTRVTALTNGNYVTASEFWHSGATPYVGAATWGSGLASTGEVVSASNSLVGSSMYDFVSVDGVVALSNGNYVVASDGWKNETASAAGAVTWGDGNSAVVGAVSASNSLVGQAANDHIGKIGTHKGVFALTNGNYVVASAGSAGGAATWCDGSAGCPGSVSIANSLMGFTSNSFSDAVGITALSNGNYVAYDGNFATLGNGASGSVGTVSNSNSLTGFGGLVRVSALTNGNYVVISYLWGSGGVTNKGAVTWGDGTAGTVGTVSPDISLVGTAANDSIGSNGVVALANGNYVVMTPTWTNQGTTPSAGAVTWGNGTTGIHGVVSVANSLIGTHSHDDIGNSVTALSQGNYVVSSPQWNQMIGASTWGDGTVGVAGSISAVNSLVGAVQNDNLSDNGNLGLSDGSYVVVSSFWHNGSTAAAGATTWVSGTTGGSGLISANDSLVGTQTGDRVGDNGISQLSETTNHDAEAFPNGAYLIVSRYWNASTGALTLLHSGSGGNTVTPDNSIIGGDTRHMHYAYDAAADHLVVGIPDANVVKILRPDVLFQSNFE